MIEVGLTTDIEVSPALAFPTASSPAASETRQTSLLREVGGFGLKALLLIGILVVAGTAGVNSVIDNVRVSAREVANQFQHVGGSNFWRGVLKSIDEEADHDMPVEQKQHLLAQIRLIVQKWHPFIVEAAQLFAVDKSSAAGQPPK